MRRRPSCFWKTLERLGVLQLLDLALRRLERTARLRVALEIVARPAAAGAVGRLRRQCAWMISASQLAATRAILPLSSGVTLTRVQRAGNEVAHLLRGAVDDDPRLLEQLRQLLIAGLAVVALRRRPRPRASPAPIRAPSAAGAAAGGGRRRRRRTPSATPIRRRARGGRRLRRRGELGHRLRDRVRSRIRARPALPCTGAAEPPPRCDGRRRASRRRGRRDTAGSASFAGAPRPGGRSSASFHLDQLAGRRRSTRRTASCPRVPASRELDIFMHRHAGRVGGERPELLLEPAFAQREIGRASAASPGAWSRRPSTYSIVLVVQSLSASGLPSSENRPCSIAAAARDRARTRGSCGSRPPVAHGGWPARRRCRARPGRACRRPAPRASRCGRGTPSTCLRKCPGSAVLALHHEHVRMERGDEAPAPCGPPACRCGRRRTG